VQVNANIMANVSFFLDKRTTLKTGNYRVRIRVSHDRRSIFFSTKYAFTEKEYNKLLTGKNMNNDTEIQKAKRELNELVEKANKIIEALPIFSFDIFRTRYEQKGDRADLIFLLREKANRFHKIEKFGSERLYNQAANLWERYAKEKKKSDNMLLSQIDAKELKSFELWASKLEKPSYTPTTIGMYLIRTKAIFNEVIKSGELSPSRYPFGKDKYTSPKATNHKRPLSTEEMIMLYNYTPRTQGESFAKDMFIFSYLANGMNMIDIFRLKYIDLESDRFTFIRTKTGEKRSEKITVFLRGELEDIIQRNKVHVIGSDYIFKVLTNNQTPKEQFDAVRSKISDINANLKKIAKKLGLTDKISTYYARHSYATNLMENEAPIALISKKLGHKDIATTQNYLSQFTKESEEKYTANLLKKA
jgi:integrase